MNSFALAAFLEPPTTKITERKVFGLTFYALFIHDLYPFKCDFVGQTKHSVELICYEHFFFQRLCYGRDPGRTSKNVPRQAPVVAPVARLQ